MFNSVPHGYSHFSNKILNWFEWDDEERFNKNLIDNKTEIKEWVDNKFTYSFNSYGFRSNKFNLDPSVMFLGCSHTMGLGLPFEHTFSSIISKELNLKNFNLANCGGSNDLAFRMAYNWIPQLKPKIVFLFSPEAARLELLTIDNEVHLFGPWKAWQSMSNDSYWSKFISNNINFQTNKIKNQLAIKYICNELNIKLHIFDTIDITTNQSSPFYRIDLARDLIHPGIKTNKNIATHMLSML